jgi:hypothetical protein
VLYHTYTTRPIHTCHHISYCISSSLTLSLKQYLSYYVISILIMLKQLMWTVFLRQCVICVDLFFFCDCVDFNILKTFCNGDPILRNPRRVAHLEMCSQSINWPIRPVLADKQSGTIIRWPKSIETLTQWPWFKDQPQTITKQTFLWWLNNSVCTRHCLKVLHETSLSKM